MWPIYNAVRINKYKTTEFFSLQNVFQSEFNIKLKSNTDKNYFHLFTILTHQISQLKGNLGTF